MSNSVNKIYKFIKDNGCPDTALNDIRDIATIGVENNAKLCDLINRYDNHDLSAESLIKRLRQVSAFSNRFYDGHDIDIVALDFVNTTLEPRHE